MKRILDPLAEDDYKQGLQALYRLFAGYCVRHSLPIFIHLYVLSLVFQ